MDEERQPARGSVNLMFGHSNYSHFKGAILRARNTHTHIIALRGVFIARCLKKMRVQLAGAEITWNNNAVSTVLGQLLFGSAECTEAQTHEWGG